MKKLRIFIAILFVLAGVGVALFPFINKKITEKKQKEMIDSVKDEILKNANKTNKTNKKNNNSDNSSKVNNKSKKKTNELDLKEEEVKEKDVLTKFSNQEVVGIIEIKKLKIMFAIVEGTERENIRVAIGHMLDTARLGQKGNCVLAGHRGGIYGEFFKHINKLEKGDEVILTDLTGKEYRYKVYDSLVISPTDFSVTKQNDKESILTLITCEEKGKKRLVIKAKLK